MANNAGDFELGDLQIEGHDFSTNFVSMLFQEHLFSPFMRTHVRVNQYQGAQMYLDGTKESTISFNTPTMPKRKYVMATDGIMDVKTDDNQRSRTFTVHLVSKHAIVNNSTPNYQKSFKNRAISDVIGSILKDGLGVSIPVNIDKTKGLQGSDNQPIILTQKSPLKHIDDLRRMAVSDQNYDGFLMFAGIGKSGGEELNFKSIYDMLQGSVVATLTHKTNFEMNQSLGMSMMNNVIEMWYPKQTSAMAKTASFSRGTTRYDINKAVGDAPRLQAGKARQQFGSHVSTNPGNVSGFVNDPYNKMPGTGNVILEDSRRPDSNRAMNAPYTEALFSDMMQNALTVKIPGHSGLHLGDIVDFDMRENTENFSNKDTKFSGKNMIAGISHYIGPAGDSPRYVTYLDLVNVQTANKMVK